jgi:hypothetical protein
VTTLSGTIPTELGRLTSLTDLVLGKIDKSVLVVVALISLVEIGVLL